MDIEAIKGDNEFYDLAMIRDEAPVNLTGANVKAWFTAKRTEDDLHADAVISLNSTDHPTQVVFLDRPGGLLYVQLIPDNTKNIEEDSLMYDVQVREQSGRVTTIQRGELKLKRDITRQTV